MNAPSHFGRYQVKRVLGEGQMGTVYLAEDPRIGRPVAIKVIRGGLASDAEVIDEARERFEREIRLAGTFSHPNIVAVHDVGQDEQGAFIIMEYVDGGSLEANVAEKQKLSFAKVADLTETIGSALDYLHGHDVVHRDVKPANILLTAAGVPKLTDFGVARLVGSTLTRQGTAYGSPAYMSPEQATAQELGGASDQFSLAIIAYQALTGELPFTGGSVTAVVFGILKNDPAPPELLNPLIPSEVGGILMRALAKNPSDRYPSCTSFAESLQNALGLATTAVAGKPENPEGQAATVAYTPVPTSTPTPQHQEGPVSPDSWASAALQLRGIRAGMILLVIALAAVFAGWQWTLAGARSEAPGESENPKAASAAVDHLPGASGEMNSATQGSQGEAGWTLTAAGNVPDKFAERSRNAAAVLEELLGTPEQSIPASLLADAQCVAVIPGVKKIGFGLGGRYGRGLVSCRTGGGWSRPSFVSLAGGSVGLQIGAQSTDFVLVFANEQAARRLLERRFTIGGDASVSAGPVGRTVEAGTDVKLQTEIYSYSRSRGLFAGVSLEGARLATDENANEDVYGRGIGPQELLFARGGALPAELAVFVRNLERFAS